MKRLVGVVIAGALSAIALPVASQAQSTGLQEMEASNAAGTAGNGVVRGAFTVGQPVVGHSSNGSQSAYLGFWKPDAAIASVHSGADEAVRNVSISPNPANRPPSLVFTPQSSGMVTVDVYSTNGERISRQRSQGMSGKTVSLELPTANLPAGSYIVRLKLGDSVTNVPLIVGR
jgi:hypothetical protein